MKILKTLMVCVLISVFVLTACAPAAAEPQVKEVIKEVEKEVVVTQMVEVEVAADPGQPKYGGTLKIAAPSVIHLNVNDVNQYGLNEIAQLFYETLVDRGPSGEIEPLLLKEYEISDDGLEHTWHLQEGVTFHSGAPFNAEVVKYNLDRKIEMEKPIYDAIPFKSIDVVDDNTVKVTLSKPHTAMYNYLTMKTFSMYNPALVEEIGDEGLKNQADGTGPFVVEEFIPNETLKLTKNENYWQEGKPYLDAIEVMIVPDNNTRAAMLEAGDTHIGIGLSIQDIDRFKLNDAVSVRTSVGSRSYYLSLTNTHPPLDNANIRRALNHAMDKEGMARTIFLNYVFPSHSHLLTAALLGYAPQPIYEYDPEKAMAMMDAEGFVDSDGDGVREWEGKPVELALRTRKGVSPGDIETAEQTQALLANVGVKVRVDIADSATFFAELNKPIEEAPYYDMINLSWGSFSGDAEYPMHFAYKCDSIPDKGYNYSQSCDPALDALMDEADAKPTLEERNKLYEEVQKMKWDSASDLYLFESTSQIAFLPVVKGLYPDAAQTIWPAKYAWLDE